MGSDPSRDNDGVEAMTPVSTEGQTPFSLPLCLRVSVVQPHAVYQVRLIFTSTANPPF
jgi:hypothetical protein